MTQGLRIVVADDEPDMREYFRRALPRLGHQVVGVASTGRELLELCRTTHPDLVITDLNMPDLNGVDAATELARRQALAVLVVSAHHDADPIVRASLDHIHTYLVKPIKQADLNQAITLAWEKFQQQDELHLAAGGAVPPLPEDQVTESPGERGE